MSNRIEFTLSADEVEAILHAINYSEYKEVRPRATAIHLLHQGHTVRQAAVIMGVEPVTIYEWFHRFKQNGVAGLRDKPGRGRRRKATDEYIRLLEDALDNHPPADYGYGFSVWTAGRLSTHLEEATGITLSERTLQELMSARGYVYRSPKESLKYLQDAQAVAAARAQLSELKRGRRKQGQTENQSTSWSLWTKQPPP
jgi:transposase